MKALENFLESRELSETSKYEYKESISNLISFLNEHHINGIEDFDNDLYESFVLDLKSNNYKISSINKYISIINNYCFYLYSNGYISKIISKKPFKRTKKGNKKIINKYEFKEIIELIKAHDSENNRNLRIIFLLYKTPLNLKEILSLRVSDFIDDFQFVQLNGKRIAMSQETVEFLRNEKICEVDGFIFKNYKGGQLSRQSVWKMLKKYNQELSTDLSIDLLNRSYKINKMLENYQ